MTLQVFVTSPHGDIARLYEVQVDGIKLDDGTFPAAMSRRSESDKVLCFCRSFIQMEATLHENALKVRPAWWWGVVMMTRVNQRRGCQSERRAFCNEPLFRINQGVFVSRATASLNSPLPVKK